MEYFKCFQFLTCMITLTISIPSVNSQQQQQQIIRTPCTTSMISSFTPCFNYFTGSNSNGSTIPISTCCGSLNTLMSTSVDCACLILTANVPLPANGIVSQTLALSLPRACKMSGVPVQCKATGVPLPSPGPLPLLLGPPAPSPPSTSSPQVSKAITIQRAAAPKLQFQSNSPLGPVSSPEESPAPPTGSRIQPLLQPYIHSTAYTTISQPSLPILFIGTLIFICY